ncbi:MAG: histone deacetylase [Anaerolineales bacterium]|nr:histone deacetylase [Anaerolineales bacterium]
MAKFGRLYEILVRDGVAAPDQFHCPEPAPTTTITLAHAPEYVAHYLEGRLDDRAMRRIGFPWSPALALRTRTALASTLLTAELALQHGLACSTAGGTHHAHYDFGSGYCIFNDLAVTARHLIQQERARRVLIVDLDVHQGDGTAAILQHDPDIFTFSIHCDANFPYRKQQSDLDVALPPGTTDTPYLATLESHLTEVSAGFRPDLVLYDAGVDPHREDALGKLALTDAGLFQRDTMVLQRCVSLGIPVACVIGGGYSHDIDALAYRHSIIHRVATEIFQSL